MNTELVNHAFDGEDDKKQYSLVEAMQFFWNKGLINVGELAEQAISKACNVKQVKRNAQGCDLADGSEVKYATVFHDNTTSYATIGGFKNKTGTIRGWVYEVSTDKNYYFLIPHETYSQYFGTKTTMKVWFNANGTPKNPTKGIYKNLWLHQTDKKTFMSFTE